VRITASTGTVPLTATVADQMATDGTGDGTTARLIDICSAV
jgi:hypothetical protein